MTGFSPYLGVWGKFHVLVVPLGVERKIVASTMESEIGPAPRGTGPEFYPSNDGKNPSFGRVFPSKPGFFPSQTNVQSLWAVRRDYPPWGHKLQEMPTQRDWT